MSGQRPIMILTASAGAGHTIAARGIEAALRALAPDEPIEVHDVLAHAGRGFRQLYGGGYLALVRHFPVAMGWLYDRMDAPPGPEDRVRRAVQRLFTGRVVRVLVRRRPKLIINTHFLPAEIVAGLRRAGRLDCPQVTVTTDFETHRMWVQPPTERYYTATEQGRVYLATWGVPAERVLVTGIPVRPGFGPPADRSALRRTLGLRADVPVVLLLSSAGGVAPAELLLRELIEMPAEAQVVAIAGHYTKLRDRLARQARDAVRPVTVVGFTERMHEWMQAADVVVTKPGGLTVAEALVCGVPLVIVNPIPGQETRNSDYLLQHGAAVKVNNPRLLGYHVTRLLRRPTRLQALRTATRRIARPDAATRIARDALAWLAPAGGLTKAAAGKESVAARS